MSTLAELQNWYSRQCNGLWEHSSGVEIQSCDNPGWWVKININGTAMESCTFPEISEGVDSQRLPLTPKWLSCRLEGNIWHGAGDETKLEQILKVFLTWAAVSET